MRYTHSIAALTAAFMFVGAHVGLASAKCLTIDEIKAKGGWDITAEIPDFEPYWFVDSSGTFVGMDVDLLKAVNAKLGIPATRYTTIPWEGVLPSVLTGKSDFIPEAIVATEERKKAFAFGHPYGDSGVVILTRKDSGIKSSADLANRVIAAQTGGAPEASLLQVKARYQAAGGKDFTTKSYQGTADELLDLQNKRVEAVVASRPVAATFVTKHPEEFMIAGLLDQPSYASWAYRPADMGGPGCIGTEIDKVLVQLREDGTLGKLQAKWFGAPVDLPAY